MVKGSYSPSIASSPACPCHQYDPGVSVICKQKWFLPCLFWVSCQWYILLLILFMNRQLLVQSKSHILFHAGSFLLTFGVEPSTARTWHARAASTTLGCPSAAMVCQFHIYDFTLLIKWFNSKSNLTSIKLTSHIINFTCINLISHLI